MKAFFNDFRKFSSDSLNVLHALDYCRENDVTELVFEQGEYHFDPDHAAEATLRTSNHGYNGLHRIAFLLEKMENFTIDGGNSLFVFDSIMNMFALLKCRNVTLRNFTVKMNDLPYPEGTVTAADKDTFELRFDYPEEIDLKENYVSYHGRKEEIVLCNEFDGATHETAYGTDDIPFGAMFPDLDSERIGPNTFRIKGAKRIPPPGNRVVLVTGRRYSTGIFLKDCTDTLIENVTFHSGVGMGVIAQTCHNIGIKGCTTTAEEGRAISMCADATHFVACTGTIRLTDCLFEHQLDDALNIHGIYTPVTEAYKGGCIVKYMHREAKGIETLRPGDRVCSLPPDTLLPDKYLTIKTVREINSDLTELIFEEPETLTVGHNIENLTCRADLYMARCVIRNNRARGILLASGGKTVIEDCDFHTGGVAILFESNGSFWYESGATTDVRIVGNRFEGCKYGGWGRGVIAIAARDREEPGRYYHGRLEISGNTFMGCHEEPALINNTEEFIFQDNAVIDSPARLELSHVGKTDIQEGIAY